MRAKKPAKNRRMGRRAGKLIWFATFRQPPPNWLASLNFSNEWTLSSRLLCFPNNSFNFYLCQVIDLIWQSTFLNMQFFPFKVTVHFRRKILQSDKFIMTTNFCHLTNLKWTSQGSRGRDFRWMRKSSPFIFRIKKLGLLLSVIQHPPPNIYTLRLTRSCLPLSGRK